MLTKNCFGKMERVEAFFIGLNNFIWGPPLLVLLTFCGVYYTLMLRGVQFRYFIKAFYLSFKKHAKHEKGDLSFFEALMTMLAGTIGIGSIAGVATALTIGGVGALFWMWVAAFLGMATKYSESVLAIKYRKVDSSGNISGGPMYYIERGTGKKWLARTFSMLAIFTTLFGIGNMIQSNSVALALTELVDLNPLYSGILLSILIAISLFGGIKYLGKISAVLVPAMALFYILGGLTIILIHANKIPEAFAWIVKSAFNGQAATGGFLGATIMQSIQMGLSRGVFSSEAGLGSSPIIAAAAKTSSGPKQGLSAMLSVFITTSIVCSITGLVIVLTGSHGALDPNGDPLNGSALVIHAFNSTLPFGGLIVTIALIPFAFSTMISWAYLGEKCMEYLFGIRSVLFYRILYISLVIPGALLSLNFMWTVANLLNGLMAFPNLIVLLSLSSVVIEESKSLPSLFTKKIKEEKVSSF